VDYQDVTIVCVDCRSEFIHDASAQIFYDSRGWTPPKRCPECRARKRVRMGDPPYVPQEQHIITCSECGRTAAVPFEPDTSRAVFCPPCYSARRENRS
jgi:CxxC-x17-CxxC domain-containing protein